MISCPCEVNPFVPNCIFNAHLHYIIAFIVYRMGRLCGGAHEISSIKAPIFLHGWVGDGGVWVVGWGVVGWVVVGGGVGGGGVAGVWVGGGGVGGGRWGD